MYKKYKTNIEAHKEVINREQVDSNSFANKTNEEIELIMKTLEEKDNLAERYFAIIEKMVKENA